MPMKNKAPGMLFTMAAIVFVFVLPHLGWLPMFTYVFPVLLFIWLYLKRSGENFASIGFSTKRFEWTAVYMGAITGIGLFGLLQWVFFPLLTKLLPLEPANLQDFANVRHHTGMYIFVLCMGWIVGGIYEEIVFHGFIFSRLEKMLPRNYARAIAVVLTALLFAAYHFQLGLSGMVNALLAGVGYQLIMLRYKRNGWYSFFAHGVFDTIGITFIYWGYW
jgi:uncharacterized protein